MSTRTALAGLGTAEAMASTLSPSWAQRAVDTVSGWMAARTSRRGFLVRAGLVGTALAVDPKGYVLTPGTAYASVCGPGATFGSGWTVFCATINNGVNSCPPGSVAAGWWRADGASLCGGKTRYIVDCNATCAKCSTPGGRAGICSSSCWSCSCTRGPSTSCDQRKNCCNAFRYGQCHTEVRQVGAVQCRVVSCTPPWRWEACSTAPATDNRTRDHNSDALPARWSPLTARHVALGEQLSPLGNTVYGEFAVPGGRAQRYQKGRMSFSQATGARETVGPIATRYVALRAESGALGFPTASPVVVGMDRRGRASRFQRGRISWHPDLGAFETLAHITLRYEKDRAEAGELGFPIAAEGRWGSDGRGRFTRFQRGRITYVPGVGVFLMRKPTADRYALLGAEEGVLGVATADEKTVAYSTGHATPYLHGRISWHQDTGAWETRGDIAQAYLRAGAEKGLLGYPVAGEEQVPGGAGRFSRFQRGRTSSSPQTGAHWVRGPIAERYEQLGAELGSLGFPVEDETSPSAGVRRSVFQRGTITYDEASGQTTVELAPTDGASPSPSPG